MLYWNRLFHPLHLLIVLELHIKYAQQVYKGSWLALHWFNLFLQMWITPFHSFNNPFKSLGSWFLNILSSFTQSWRLGIRQDLQNQINMMLNLKKGEYVAYIHFFAFKKKRCHMRHSYNSFLSLSICKSWVGLVVSLLPSLIPSLVSTTDSTKTFPFQLNNSELRQILIRFNPPITNTSALLCESNLKLFLATKM